MVLRVLLEGRGVQEGAWAKVDLEVVAVTAVGGRGWVDDDVWREAFDGVSVVEKEVEVVLEVEGEDEVVMRMCVPVVMEEEEREVGEKGVLVRSISKQVGMGGVGREVDGIEGIEVEVEAGSGADDEVGQEEAARRGETWKHGITGNRKPIGSLRGCLL